MASSLPTPPETADEQKWWVADGGVAEGPFGAAYIITAMKTGLIGPTTLACPVGAQQWRSVSDCPEFAGIAAAVPPPLPPPLPGHAAQVHQPPLVTNPLLPSMANWICIYCIAISPVLWAFNNLSGMTFFDFGVLGPLVSTGITVLLLVGGLRLRDLRLSGRKTIKIAFWIDMGIFALSLVLVLLSASSGSGASGAPSQPQNANPEVSPFAVLARLINFSAYGFELIGLIWLHRHGKSLGETSHSVAVAGPQQPAAAKAPTGNNEVFRLSESQIPSARFEALSRNRDGAAEAVEKMTVHATLPKVPRTSQTRDVLNRKGSQLGDIGNRKEWSVMGFIIFWIIVLCLRPLVNHLTDRIKEKSELSDLLRRLQTTQTSSQSGKQ
jgi:hypothetical protein